MSSGTGGPTEGDEVDAPLLGTVARNVPIVLFALDEDGVFTRSEGRGLAALGLEQNEVVGESVYDLYADYPEIIRAVDRAHDGENVNTVLEIEDTAFETWYRPMDDGRVLGVSVDVTDRVKHERLMERLNEANRRLLSAGSKQAVADMVVEIAQEVLDQPYTGVWVYESERDELVSVAGDGPAREYRDRVIGADTVEMDVYRSGEVRLFEDYRQVDRPAFPEASVGTLLLLPLGDHGLLSVASPEVVEIEPADRDLIEILARDATVALDRAKRERLLERLNEATRELVVAESPDEIADLVVEINRQVLDEPASVVWYYDPDDGVLEPVAWTTEEVAADRPSRPFHELAPIEPGTAEMAAFLGREPVFFEDYHSIDAPAHPETELGAILAVPIGDRGLLTVGVATAADIDPSTIDLVEILARDATVAIERVEREQAVEHLHAATRALMAAETKAEIARRTVDTTEEILGHPKAVVRLLSEDGDRLEPVARSDWIRENLPDRPSFRVGEGSIGGAFERGEVMRFDRSELSELGVEGATQTLLCLPLGDHGVLSIGEAGESAFDDSDVQLAKVFASNVEAALDRVDHELELARRNERLDQFAEIVSHDLRNPL
ncbi:MAG TPA: GAF domain-containing protein, partial [Halobacteriales archaeon]|nr:GAF domain-containing protein [Halobacteriales archaeon]